MVLKIGLLRPRARFSISTSCSKRLLSNHFDSEEEDYAEIYSS